MRLLLAAGAKVNARDKKGHTPIGYVPADQPNSGAIVDLLRRAGGKED